MVSVVCESKGRGKRKGRVGADDEAAPRGLGRSSACPLTLVAPTQQKALHAAKDKPSLSRHTINHHPPIHDDVETQARNHIQHPTHTQQNPPCSALKTRRMMRTTEGSSPSPGLAVGSRVQASAMAEEEESKGVGRREGSPLSSLLLLVERAREAREREKHDRARARRAREDARGAA